jgi:hypothetical protein
MSVSQYQIHSDTGLIYRGWVKLPGFKVGGSWRFRKSEIDAWIKEQEKKAKTDGGKI